MQTDFPTSVNNVVLDPAEGGDGVRGRLRRQRDHDDDEGEAAVRGFNVFAFPSIATAPGASAVEIGGDLIVTFSTTRRSRRS